MKDTSPEINEMIFQRVMELTPGERLKMGCSMTATARALVWSSIPKDLGPNERRDMFIERFYGPEFAAQVKGKLRDWLEEGR